jgi:hypothetical protein
MFPSLCWLLYWKLIGGKTYSFKTIGANVCHSQPKHNLSDIIVTFDIIIITWSLNPKVVVSPIWWLGHLKFVLITNALEKIQQLKKKTCPKALNKLQSLFYIQKSLKLHFMSFMDMEANILSSLPCGKFLGYNIQKNYYKFWKLWVHIHTFHVLLHCNL